MLDKILVLGCIIIIVVALYIMFNGLPTTAIGQSATVEVFHMPVDVAKVVVTNETHCPKIVILWHEDTGMYMVFRLAGFEEAGAVGTPWSNSIPVCAGKWTAATWCGTKEISNLGEPKSKITFTIPEDPGEDYVLAISIEEDETLCNH